MISRYPAVLVSVLLLLLNPYHTQGQGSTVGESLYSVNCTACHGDSGQGGLGSSLIGCGNCSSLQDLIVKIESAMPPTDPSSCIGDCASDTAAYIFSVFNTGVIITDPIVDTIDKGDLVIELETIAAGLTAPIDLKSSEDGSGRLFVTDQSGLVRIIQDGQLLPEPFLDVTNRMVTPLGIIGSLDESDYDERGLLGFAFHPGYSDPQSPGFGKIYTHISEPVAGTADFSTPLPPGGSGYDNQGVIAEWQVDPADPNRISTGSYREIMRIDQPQFNHDGGVLEFGPDGYLYIPLGDGGNANDRGDGHGDQGNGQNLSTVHGSILRIDPLDPERKPASPDPESASGNYRIPSDNPFVGSDGLDEIYAFGFRNPFRISFDTAGYGLIAADVGQNNLEEIDIVSKGGNYGWSLKEGTFDFVPETGGVTDPSGALPAGLTDPVVQYDHDDGISIIGGYVYRGNDIPELSGYYVFGDFSSAFSTPDGRLLYADLSTGILREFNIGIQDTPLGLFVKGLGRDSGGELYVLASDALGPYGTTGVVLKLRPSGYKETGSDTGTCFIRTLMMPLLNRSR